jgi:hypothetical protein
MANIFSDTVTVARPRPRLQLKHRLGQFLEEDGAPLVLTRICSTTQSGGSAELVTTFISGRRYACRVVEGKVAPLRRSLHAAQTQPTCDDCEHSNLAIRRENPESLSQA